MGVGVGDVCVSLSPSRLNIFTVGIWEYFPGVMICLGQGGLRSLGASSVLFFIVFGLVSHFTKGHYGKYKQL